MKELHQADLIDCMSLHLRLYQLEIIIIKLIDRSND